ncbi:MAG: GntR family transcriptional regulator [Oscillospiraceae bacterium]|nr:GntR family transcriptional regulator [Oscillospiraceae bacterium]
MAGDTLNHQVYRRIKDDIMFLVLEPGLALSVQKLADRYGSSRTPVREAVVRLQQEGLVIIYPQARTIVSPISVGRICQERFVRNALELSMVDSFIKNCSVLVTDTLENMIGIQKRMILKENFRGFMEMDQRFHGLLFRTADQQLAAALIQSSNTHYNRGIFLAIKHWGVCPETLPEHEAIVAAARARDEEQMRVVLQQHLDRIGQQTTELKRIFPQYFQD